MSFDPERYSVPSLKEQLDRLYNREREIENKLLHSNDESEKQLLQAKLKELNAKQDNLQCEIRYYESRDKNNPKRMKKIIFATLPFMDGLERRYYRLKYDRFSAIGAEDPFYFAVNPAVAGSLKKDDELKVILLKTKGSLCAKEEAKIFIDELNAYNKVGAKIVKEIIPSAFDLSKTNFRFMFKTLIKELEQGAEIYADVTYGPKPLAFLLITVIQFAEKFFDCQIGNIVYSNVEFFGDKPTKKVSEMGYDITPLYLLNSFINTIESSTGEKAIKAVESLFED